MEDLNQKKVRWIKITALIGRIIVILAVIALISAWITQLTGKTFLGMTQQHLFNDAMALALLAIAFFLDALLHDKNY